MSTKSPNQEVPSPFRRDFFKKCCAGIIGTVLGLVPLAAGLGFFLDPLRRKTSTGGFLRLTTLEALPDDGLPHRFPVLANRVDAWNKFTQTPVGAVYLRRTTDGKLQAFNVICPHAGCFVEFRDDLGKYRCPCHDSTFTLAGKIDNPSSPAPRGLDLLEVEIRNQTEVWVRFQNFQAGQAEKTPVA